MIKLTSKERVPLRVVFSSISLVFCFYYFAFFVFVRYFRSEPSIDKQLLNSWVWPTVTNKGYEMYILFVCTLIFTVLSYFVIVNNKFLPFLNNRLIQFLLISALFLKIVLTDPKIIGINTNFFINILQLFIVSFVIFIAYRFSKLTGKLLLLFSSLFWVSFGLLVTLSIREASYIDFNMFVGPALKLLDGDAFGSFYMQYGLFETLVFKQMMTFGFKLYEMQLVLSLIATIFFILYYRVALRFIENRFLVFLFMLSIILVRFLSLSFPIASSPQANPIRLDIWLPLIYVVSRFGILSPLTSLTFSAVYLADDFFGFLFLVVYIASILIYSKKSLRKIVVLLVPIFLSIALHTFTFGSIFSQAAGIVSGLHYWQLPISHLSMFWSVVFVLPLYLYLVTREKKDNSKVAALMFLAFAQLELIYFFGRSHEHNLLTTSGILILLFYIALDKIRVTYKVRTLTYVMSILLIFISSTLFSKMIVLNFKTAYTNSVRKQLSSVNKIDVFIDSNPNFLESFGNRDIYILSQNDSYFNYRYKLRQLGYYSPFFANLYKEETISYMKSLNDRGYTILVEEGNWFNIEEYNSYLQTRGITFDVKNSKSIGDVKFNQLLISHN